MTLAAVLGIPEDTLREAAGLASAPPAEDAAAQAEPGSAFFDDPEAEFEAWQRVVEASSLDQPGAGAPVPGRQTTIPMPGEGKEREGRVMIEEAALAVPEEAVEPPEPAPAPSAARAEPSPRPPAPPIQGTAPVPPIPAPEPSGLAAEPEEPETAAEVEPSSPMPEAPAVVTPAAPTAQQVAASSPASAATAVIPERAPAAPVPRSYLEDPQQMITYWVRAGMTVVLAVFLLIVFVWAMARLGESLGEVWELFKAGA